MKIIIVGAGRVGSSLAESLVSEHNDITIIDPDPKVLSALSDRYDLRTIVGNGVHPSILREAGANDAHMLVAVTRSDETNLVACRMAARHFNVPNRIARVRSAELADQALLKGEQGFDVDQIICPEQSVTDDIVRLVEFPEALQVQEFANGLVSLVAVRAFVGGPLVSNPIKELRKHLPNVDARIVAVFRDNHPLLVDGDTMIHPGDEVCCLAATKNIRNVLSELRQMVKPVQKVMIAGGGNIGFRLAHALQDNYQVKIIELNRARCEHLSINLKPQTLVLNGDATDENLLEEENVQNTDLFVALTNDDENNIMASLLAKRMGAPRVISLIQRRVYGDLMQGGQIDIAMAPSQATLSAILKYIRRGDVVAVQRLRRGAAEAIEAVAHGNAKSSRVIGKTIEQIELPKGAMIAAVVRRDKVLIAHHDTMIEAEDHVITFVQNKNMIAKVENLFQVGVGFF